MISRLLLCAILFFIPLSTALAQDDAATSGDTWKIMFQRNVDEIRYQITYTDGISHHLPDMIQEAKQRLASLRKKMDELMVLARVSESNPMELRAVLGGLNILNAQMETLAQPFRKADQDLKNFQTRIESLETEFSNQQAAGAPVQANAASKAEDAAQTDEKPLADFLTDIRKLKERLDRGRAMLDQILVPTRDMQTAIAQTSKTVTERIPLAWHDYYLTPGSSLLSWRAWKEGAMQLADLPQRVSTVGSLLGGAGQGKITELLGRVLGLLAVFVAIWAILLKKAGAGLPWLKSRRLLRALSWASAGVAVLWATSGTSFILVHAETTAVAEILLARGLLGFAWYLRGLRTKAAITCMEALPAGPASRPQTGEREECSKADASVSAPTELASAAPPDSARKPGARAWWMFAAATLLDLPWLPDVARAGPWILLLLWAGFVIRHSKLKPGRDLTARLSAAGGFVYPLLCLPTLFGWVNLTLLVAKGWFLLLAFLQTGIALNSLARRLLSLPAKNLASKVLLDLAGGIATPLAAIACTGGFLFWLSVSLGGRSVFWSIINANVAGKGMALDLLRLAEIFTGFYLARAATRVVQTLIARLPDKHPDLEHGIVNLLETLSTYAIWGLFALVVLELLGASLTSIAVVAGGLSVGIGFGLQHVINNFISGLILLFGRSVQAGDVLQIGDIWGTVQRVNIRHTVLQTVDNATLFVPNSDLITQKVMNWSHKDRRVRRILDVGVAYGSDVDTVRRLLLKAAASRPHVLAIPKPVVQLVSFGDMAIRFKLFFWVDDLDNAARVVSEVYVAVDRLFQEEGITIPHNYPKEL